MARANRTSKKHTSKGRTSGKPRREKPPPDEAQTCASRHREERRKENGVEVCAWSSIELEDLNPLLQRQFVVGQEIMVARVLLKKGCIVPLHSHHNEQVTYILEGALKFWIDGRRKSW